jgi:hypothetical protein
MEDFCIFLGQANCKFHNAFRLSYLVLLVLFYKSFEISNLKLNARPNASSKFQVRQVHLSFTTCNIDYRRLQPIDIVSRKLV